MPDEPSFPERNSGLNGFIRLAHFIRTQLSINGQKVGDEFLAPGWTDYKKRIQSQTYDVTLLLLRKGDNVIGAALGDGWYRGNVGMSWRGVYGNTLALVAKLQVTYTDDSTENFVTDENWRSADGPFIQADLQDGENYDARLEQPGWDDVSFDASLWRPVTSASDDFTKLVPQPDEPVRAGTVGAKPPPSATSGSTSKPSSRASPLWIPPENMTTGGRTNCAPACRPARS
jgi:alpha-L-rhamnosidase